MKHLEREYESAVNVPWANDIKYLNVCNWPKKQILCDACYTKPGGYINQKYTINLWVWPQTKPFNEEE
jgi:hypothetical protein